MEALKKCRLFEGIPFGRVLEMKSALGAAEQSFGSGEVIIGQGEGASSLGVVLSGGIEAVHYRPDGSFAVISSLGEGDVFADFLAADDRAHSPAAICACEPSRILFVPFASLFVRLAGFEEEQRQVLINLSRVYAEKYFELKDRLICISSPTVRGKLVNYFQLMCERTGSTTFDVPFDREGLAAYLNVDRSALSRELSKMKKDGILEYYKNSFKLKLP